MKLQERLRAKVSRETKARPTIAELEAILAETSPPPVVIQPNGEIAVADQFINPDGPEAAAQLDLYEAALREAEQWASAYPVAVFPEPDLEAVKKALGAAGILYEMDRLHASWARHLLTGIETIARAALNSTDTGA